jgi:hypothetical protein
MRPNNRIRQKFIYESVSGFNANVFDVNYWRLVMSMRSFLKNMMKWSKTKNILLHVVLFIIVLAIPAEVIYYTHLNNTRVRYITKHYKNIDDFINAKVECNDIYIFYSNPKVNSTLHFWWTGDWHKEALASGAPTYIFDAKGNLVDFTYDLGDDSRFQKRWNYAWDKRKKISLHEVNTIINDNSNPPSN